MDDTKSLNADTLMAFSKIVEMFEQIEMTKNLPKYDPNEYFDKLISVLAKVETKSDENTPEVEVL